MYLKSYAFENRLRGGSCIGGIMYILSLLLFAFFLISIFVTNWPVKLFHHHILTKLAAFLDTVPEKNGIFLGNVYSQITTIYRGKELKIRFLEATIDSLKASSGLEVRMNIQNQDCCKDAVLEFYSLRLKKREWGDFKRFLTGDPLIDNQWFILTNNSSIAGKCWDSFDFKKILLASGVGQIMVNKGELIIQFKNYGSIKKIQFFLEQLTQIK